MRRKKQYILGKGHHPASFASFLCIPLSSHPLCWLVLLLHHNLKTPTFLSISPPSLSFLPFTSLLTAVPLSLFGPDPYTLLSSVVFLLSFATIHTPLVNLHHHHHHRLHHHPVLKKKANCRYVERSHRHVHARPGGERLLASPLPPEFDNRAN